MGPMSKKEQCPLSRCLQSREARIRKKNLARYRSQNNKQRLHYMETEKIQKPTGREMSSSGKSVHIKFSGIIS